MATNVLFTSSQNDPLPDGVLVWDSLTKETNIVADAGQACFEFSFTNISANNVVIQGVQPTCGCTMAQLPPLPWAIAHGTSAQFNLTVNLLGKARKQIKTAIVQTDRGFKEIILKINILPPVIPLQSNAERVNALAMAKADRQAIFQGSCVACHVKSAGTNEDGRALYYDYCAICHEGSDHSPSVPDLFAIKTPANVDFWLDWIARGKAGSLMPAFSREAGGPLSEMQIAYIARYLNTSDDQDAP